VSWRSVPTPLDWVAMERAVLERWRSDRVFARSMELRAGGEPYVFYEGPPTANGRPGSHHVLSRVFKDIFPRYRTMQGRYVARKGGWDCHGLPVELEVEKQLGISGKPEIEAFGIAEFNARCRESVQGYLDEWERLTERIGFWVDTGEAYRTMDTPYIESVWWSLKTLWDRGLIYEADKVVPYCPRCGTALSSHEVALGYRDVDDPSVYVRFPLRDDPGASLLVWTTTPWTLPSNQAAAVHPGVTYAEAVAGGERFVLAEALVARVLGDDARVVRTFPATELVGRGYEPPFPYVEGAHRVVAAAFVTTDDGTGIVHIAPPFGEDDMQVGRENDLPMANPVDRQGRFTDAVGPYAGRFVKDADPDLVTDLDARGVLYRVATYTHAYPHCWRCGTPLLYYAKPSWYIRTTAVRDRLLGINRQINWYPEHVRDGRFGKWLEGNVDWAISRERYWGTPLPLWRCGDCDRVHAVGGFDELRAVAVNPPGQDFDPHRPGVDEVLVRCDCGGEARRVPEVIDVWYDSGAMPFAQHHYPFAGEGVLEGRFPADYICEAQDQTRGWFYSLHAEATMLFDGPAYRNVVCLGLILDGDGQKMSKSKGNVIEPWSVLDEFGADPFRWYLFTAQSAGESFRFSMDAIRESGGLLRTLWNTYAFLVTYAALPDGWDPSRGGPPPPDRPLIDRWALARLDRTVADVTAALEGYDAAAGGRAIAGFVDDLSNWYVRTGRRRFWRSDDPEDRTAAFATLHECLATVAKLLAPYCPFVADEMYANLVAAHDPAAPSSVHLADWPRPGGRDEDALVAEMAAVRDAVSLGRAARKDAKLRVRQPLAEVVVACSPAVAGSMQRHVGLIQDELNVRSVRFVSDPAELVEVVVKPNYRSLGPRFGKAMPAVAEAFMALDGSDVVRRLDAGGDVTIAVGGRDEAVGPDDVLREVRPSERYAVAQDGPLAVGLLTDLTEELRLEGLAREVVHAVQSARKSAGLRVEERIRLHLDGSGLLREAVDAHRGYVAAETLAAELTVSHGAPFAGTHREEHVLDGEPLAIRLDRASNDPA
jgi:isoleucyl-tRNA synthetase